MRVVSFCFTGHHFLGSSVTARAPTSRKTANDEIAHFTCTLKYNLSSAEITWQKQGHNLRDGSSGVVIISWNNGTILESHLLVAVTDDDERRGTYSCVGTDEDGQSRRSFVIQGELSFKQYLIRDIFNWVSKIIHDFFCFALRRTITVQALQAVSNPHIIALSTLCYTGKQNSFHLVSKVIRDHCFGSPLSRKVAPSFQPIKCKTNPT